MFKVLVIAYYFPPMGLSGVQRTLKFVKYMKQNNWEPTVLTTSQIGYFAHDNSLIEEAEKAELKIVRTAGKDINSLLAKKGTVKIPPEWIRKLLNRISQTFFIPDNKKSWSKKAFDAGDKLLKEEKFDLIFVSGPPFSSFQTAVKLKEKHKIPLVLDYRDLWYANQFSFYPSIIHKILHKQLEYKCLKKAEKVIVTNRKIKEKLLNYYQFLTFEDVVIIPHGFDPADFENLQVIPKDNNKLHITYSGLFYEFITPKYFLKAFKELTIERPDIASQIELHFIGHFRKENLKLVKKLKIEPFVKIHGYLPHKTSLAKIVSSDVVWIMVGESKNSDTISSGKLFEYFGMKKPIFAMLPEGNLKTNAQDYGASFICEPYDIKNIKEYFIKIFELYKNNNLPNPNEDFVFKHRRDFLTEQLVKQFQFLIKEDVI